MVLEEYAGFFAYCGTWAMLPFFVCPLQACWNIIKYGFSDFFPPNTFLDGLLRSILLYNHGKLLMSKDMMQQNLFGIILQLMYLTLYYFYLRYKAPFCRAAIKSGAFIAVTLFYVQWESPILAPQRFGYILTLLNLSTLIYPVMCVKYILTTKSTYGLPYTIIACGQVVTTFWLLFAISVHNYIFMMLIPFVLGTVQIVLYFIYPPTPNIQPILVTPAPIVPTVSEVLKEPNVKPVSTFSYKDSIRERRRRLAELRRKNIEKPSSQGSQTKEIPIHLRFNENLAPPPYAKI